MFGIGFMELLVIAVVAIVFVGPQKLPDLMRQAGRFFVQMKRTTSEVKDTIDQVIRDAENELRDEKLAGLKQAYNPASITEGTSETDDLHNPDGTLKEVTKENEDGTLSTNPDLLGNHAETPSFDTGHDCHDEEKKNLQATNNTNSQKNGDS